MSWGNGSFVKTVEEKRAVAAVWRIEGRLCNCKIEGPEAMVVVEERHAEGR